MLKTDVLIAGGGIAGLLLASELSKEADVLLIERRSELPRNKYWLTNSGCLEGNEHLRLCIDAIYPSMDFIGYEGTTMSLDGEFPMWNTDALIDHLWNQAAEAGCHFHFGTNLFSMRYGDDYLEVNASRERIRCKLMVDCMGADSPLVAA